MATVKEMKATARARSGKGAARAERRAGRVPGVIYGDNQPPVTISLDYAELRQRVFAGHFLTTIYDLEVDGAKHRVIPRDFQLDPVKDQPVHVDFMRLGEGATIRVKVPIHVKNADQAPGIKRGGTVNIVTHTIEVRCLAEAIPPAIEVDLTGLEINYSKHLSDIALPEGVRACFSSDDGETWDVATEVRIRKDFSNWDVGYPESMEMPDGRVLTVDYYNLFNRYYIGGTWWKP